ncbi:MAG: tape measure protein [Clostridium sp.]
MAEISSVMKLYDHMTKPLKSLLGAANSACSSIDKLTKAMNKPIKNKIIPDTTKQYESMIEQQRRLQREQKKAEQQQKKLEHSIRSSSVGMGSAIGSVTGLVGAYLSLQAAISGVKVIDTYTSQQARLGMINDGLQTQRELQMQVFDAAQRSRTAYGEMVNAVAKMSMLAKDAFKNNKEAVAFSELMAKSFKVSGASAQESSAGMYQLTQAMAAGKLQGDEFRSIMENAPMLAQAIAQYTGKSMGALKELSSSGQITSDIIKNALFASANDIENKFKQMPMTFSDAWTTIKNEAVLQFEGIMQRMTKTLNSADGKVMIDGIVSSIGVLANVMGMAFNGLANIAGFVSEHWGAIAPVLLTVVGLTVAFNIAAGITNTIMGISLGLKATYNAYTAISTGMTFAATAAQYGFNAALYACPLTWIIGLVIVLIGALVALIAYCEPIRSGFASAFEFIGNSAAIWFGNIVDTAQWMCNAVLSVVNAIIGGVNSASGAIASLWGGSGTNIQMVKGADFSKFKNKGISNIKGVATGGKNAINSFSADNIKKKFSGGGNKKSYGNFQMPKGYTAGAISPMAGGGSKAKGGKGDKEGKKANKHLNSIDDKMNIANENLQYMRDLAENKSVQNFVSLTPTVQVTTGPISKEVDINTVIDKIEKFLSNEVKNSVEGVYA